MGGAYKHFQLSAQANSKVPSKGTCTFPGTPTANWDSKVVRVFKTGAGGSRGLGRYHQLMTTSDHRFQDQLAASLVPEKSHHAAALTGGHMTAVTDLKRSRGFEARPLYLREPSSDFWMVAAEAGSRLEDFFS